VKLLAHETLGLLETTGFSPALVALDAMEKQAGVRLLQLELNDFLGVCLKIAGSADAVREALDAGFAIAHRMGGKPVADRIVRPDHRGWSAIRSGSEFNPLIQQDVVHTPEDPAPDDLAPDDWDGAEKGDSSGPFEQSKTAKIPQLAESKGDSATQLHQEQPVAATSNFALGLIETQGFTAVFEAIDTACKAANVEIVGKEKLGGGYVTVIVKGDVAAVHAAIDAGKAKVEGLGKLIAAHVIARPSPAVLSLLPKLAS
jgi:microcompartment protein CcmL/EutN